MVNDELPDIPDDPLEYGWTPKAITQIPAEMVVALASLKDKVMMAAGQKAANGKYRAAADILATAFTAQSKAFDKLIGTPWANKAAMTSYLAALERAEPGKNGFTKKQAEALDFIRALRTIPALAAEKSEGAVTIEATLRRVA